MTGDVGHQEIQSGIFSFMSILLSQLRLYFLNSLLVSFPGSFIFDSNANPWVSEKPRSVLHQSFNINYSTVVVCCTSVAFCKNFNFKRGP